jgi:tetratricopeptide (TPR) repeat protein
MFASVQYFLTRLRPYSAPEDDADIRRIQNYLNHLLPTASGDAPSNYGGALAQWVAYAILRRISRESASSSRLIDLSARTINRIVSRIPDCQAVCVRNADTLDRPSLKIVARAMLLLRKEDRFTWRVHSQTNPASLGGEPETPYPLYLASRHAFLRHIFEITRPRVEPNGEPRSLTPPQRVEEPSVYGASVALVMQDYDQCFLICEALLSGSAAGGCEEAYRLLALASVNAGDTGAAMRALQIAEGLASSPARKAHLAYLQGLIAAKRTYSLAESNRHYHRGLEWIERSATADTLEDPPLEQAWLLNGLALNEAILARSSPAGAADRHLSEAFAYEQRAFALVREGDSRARGYLRFNLLANLAFLLEMQGAYLHAIQLLQRAFGDETGGDGPESRDARYTLQYRAAVLHHRAGQHREALELLRKASAFEPFPENWAARQRILYALGAVASETGRFDEAREAFCEGLELCRAARSAAGFRDHLTGLARTLQSMGHMAEYEQTLARAGQEEDMSFSGADLAAPFSIAPKLPAYVPEVDLEDIPAVDINRYLSGNGGRQVGTPWRN